mmetsp:Transcript_17607/g.36466  ORF Transcript_17607/g.36466 Transcript_17607/m.36466 type:complete len:229 (+) Transcript_17607:1152-1838(+)
MVSTARPRRQPRKSLATREPTQTHPRTLVCRAHQGLCARQRPRMLKLRALRVLIPPGVSTSVLTVLQDSRARPPRHSQLRNAPRGTTPWSGPRYATFATGVPAAPTRRCPNLVVPPVPSPFRARLIARYAPQASSAWTRPRILPSVPSASTAQVTRYPVQIAPLVIGAIWVRPTPIPSLVKSEGTAIPLNIIPTALRERMAIQLAALLSRMHARPALRGTTVLGQETH